jgi:crossover junction endodeoxyribonuclease RuvC
MRFCGIDPGVDGAAAMIDTDAGAVWVADLPTGPHGIDPVALQELLTDAWGVRSVHLEDNRANGRNGSLANFSMGRSEGLIVATVLCAGIPLWRVRPTQWQRAVGLGNVKSGERKEASRLRAREMYPEMAKELSRKKDHNRAEALLIATYARKGPK